MVFVLIAVFVLAAGAYVTMRYLRHQVEDREGRLLTQNRALQLGNTQTSQPDAQRYQTVIKDFTESEVVRLAEKQWEARMDHIREDLETDLPSLFGGEPDTLDRHVRNLRDRVFRSRRDILRGFIVDELLDRKYEWDDPKKPKS